MTPRSGPSTGSGDRDPWAPRWAPWVLMALGFLLRLDQLLFNRSLWLDEAYLAPSIVRGTLRSFLRPLEYGHVVPPAFLACVKAFVARYGSHDLVFRLFPFIAGISALPLFHAASRRCLSPRGALLALLLFCVSDPLIFYASELKPYSCDVVAALALFLLAHRVASRPTEWRGGILLGAAGVAALLFSQAAVFVLAAVGIVLLAVAARARRFRTAAWLAAAGACWVAVFGILFAVATRDVPPGLLRVVADFWRLKHNAFWPGPFSARSLPWLADAGRGILVDPCGFIPPLTTAAGGALVWGAVRLLRRDRTSALMLLLPLAVAVAASTIEKYPIHGRMVLFFVPAAYLLIAEGIDGLPVRGRRASAILRAAAAVLVLAGPVWRTGGALRAPRVREEVRRVLEYVSGRIRPDEALYVYFYGDPVLRYCGADYGFDYRDLSLLTALDGPPGDHPAPCAPTAWRLNRFNATARFVIGSTYRRDGCLREFDAMRRFGRVWFFFTHCDEWAEYVAYLDRAGRRLDAREEPGCRAYLYEFGDPPRPPPAPARRPDGLVAEYALEGNAEDSSGNDRHGLLLGAEPVADRFGRPRGAIGFDGTGETAVDDLVVVPHHETFDLRALSVSVWIRAARPRGYARIVDRLRWARGEGFALTFDESCGGRVGFECFDAAGGHAFGLRTRAPLPTNAWQHVVCVYSAGAVRFYVNGEPDAVHRTRARGIRPTGRFLSFGNGYDDHRFWPFSGALDDIRIYDRPLSAREVLDLYRECR